MKPTRQAKLYQLIPAFCASIIDIAVTIMHQAPEYWAGNLAKANEGNPIGSVMMKNHVSGIFVISGLWLVLIGLLGYHLPRKWSRIFLLFAVIAHSYGASTWISPQYGFWWAMTLIAFNTVVYILIDESNKSSSALLPANKIHQVRDAEKEYVS
ncbi:hypothetical protein [Pontibacter anaerobius]|uniref:DUF5658 domain-containing protein n=1 Tax=Pontibacter anaerobius TaxID=2993940 RepID=A0ABT3RBD6_9BACT|nr:hypothetical protein [Pontibacter anaerobius]MCX2738919.1 hypothetical protein [Pontibacter anaerobius]